MSTPADTQGKPETLTIRMGTEERNLIERAAKTSGKNRNDFIRDALRRATDDALLDQVNIVATPEAYAEFLARLGIRGIITHALTPAAKSFYERVGFDISPLDTMTLMITLSDLTAALTAPRS